jgi:site-specific recombinase XerD
MPKAKKNPERVSPKIILPKSHQLYLQEFKDYLIGQRKSASTVHTYVNFIRLFLNSYNDRQIESIDNRSVEIFLEQVIAKNNYSISSHRQCVSALKHFSYLKLDFNYDPEQIKRPKKDRKLPNVLSSTEVINLLKATKNLKHKAILALLYSAGLRVGELLNLELKDIDLERNIIQIKQGKGRKDRNTSLGKSIKPVLINYAESYKPQKYLFEGTQPGMRYSASSIRQFLKVSCRSAGITKHVTPHTLRHSYATHLLESGVDVRYIQELLGHSRPETTMIYTHVSEKKIDEIKNPLDEAVNKFNKTDNTHKNLSLSRKKNK